MDELFWWFMLLLALGVVALVGYFVRLQRQSRRVAKTLEYSKMREWKDEE